VQKLTIGLSLSLSGEYASMGRQAEAAMRLFVSDTNASGGIQIDGIRHEVALECVDDQSRRERTAEIYRELCFGGRANVIFGPYSSALARAAAPLAEEAGMVMVNHGGAGDDLYARGHRMIVGVLTPASEYLTGVAGLLGTLKRVAIVCSRGPFARAVAGGFERACGDRRVRRRGVRVRMKYSGAFDPERTPNLIIGGIRRNRINAIVSAGSYEYDLAVMRLETSAHLNIPLIGCVAAGVTRFRDDLGENAEGIVGPSQWEQHANITPEIGPSSTEFVRRIRAQRLSTGGDGGCDYPAAQAYAAGLVTVAAIRATDSLDQERIRAALSDLRTTTFFGRFAIDVVTGRQTGHKMLLIQWQGGRKVIIDPVALSDSGYLQLPTGGRLIVASFRSPRLIRREEETAEGGDSNKEPEEGGQD
jgi:ABC-type branched-subunit amino acid transport system substrate-binding protein